MNVKLKYYLLWILTCVLFWIWVVIAWFVLYDRWYFDDNWSWRIVINREDTEQYQPNVDLSILETEEKNTKEDENKNTIIKIDKNRIQNEENSWFIDDDYNNEQEEMSIINEEDKQSTLLKKKKVKNDLVFLNMYELLKNWETEVDKKSFSFLKSYYLLKQLKFEPWIFELYYSKIDIKKRDINFSEEYKKVQYVNNLNSDEITKLDYENNLKKKEILQEIKTEHEKNWVLNIDTCFYKFCSDKKEEYNYIKKAIIADTDYLSILWNIKKVDWLDPKIFLTIITIENLRMHSQFKWRFKSVFVKYKTPLLANMSQMSYWMYWTKANFVKNLINENYLNEWKSIFSIWDDTTLKYIKDNFFYYNKNSKKFEYVNTNKFVDELIKDKTMQSNIIWSFMKMTRKWWLTKNVDMFKVNNLWYLLTLYNIWKLWEPKSNPETWWANLNFLSKSYSFWDLSNIVFNSLEMLDIEQQINKIMK